jgi:hypothetical protein
MSYDDIKRIPGIYPLKPFSYILVPVMCPSDYGIYIPGIRFMLSYLMFRPDMFWYILGIYLVYTKYIRITKGIYQVYTLYMTCYVDICTHETFLYAKVSHMSGIYQVYFWYVPEINYQYNIECVCSIIVGTCVVGVIVRVVLGFQTAKGETDMPTGCDVCQLLLRRSTGEQSSERDSDILK